MTGQEKGMLVAQRASLAELAAELSGKVFDRPVIDMTGLKGRYDIRLDPRALASMNPSDRSEAADRMSAALEEQLGLKIESRKAPVDVLVINHLEKKPTEN